MDGERVLVIDEEDVGRFLTLHDSLAVVERAFGAQPHADHVLPRRRLHLEGTRLNVVGGSWTTPPRLAVKAYTSGENSCVVLFDGDGALLAVIEARLLSMYRTAAATGVATRWLSRGDAGRVGILGTGYQAVGQLQAISLVRPVTEVRAWSPSSEHAAAFASRMSALVGTDVTAVASPPEAVEEADIVVTVTKSAQPILEGRWLAPGAHINLVGANQLHRRESDDDVLTRASVVVVDDLAQARTESGEILHAVEEGSIGWGEVVELSDVVRGASPGRGGDDDITVFKSLGIGLEDVAVASLVYDRVMAER